ncbi:MAG: hypothetical protein ACHP79_08560 [Terriglobales bacterium]
MRRIVRAVLVFLMVSPVLCQGQGGVQGFGDVTFAVPDGWTYTAGQGGGGMMSLKDGQRFAVMAVWPPMVSSGNAETDLLTAWNTIVIAGGGYRGAPAKPYYQINHTVGYPGRRADDSSVNRATYTRLYVLEAGRMFIPVQCVATDGAALNAVEHITNAMLGSVRLAPLKASPIKTNITTADLVGHWTSGAGSSYDFYSASTGRYESTASAFYGAGYTIAANGSFTYQMSGMVNGRVARDDDTGVVQFDKEFVVFKGRAHVVRYRFLNIQQAIDGSTVITFLPPAANPATLSFIRDSEYWVRKPGK